jgi:hypothetical protein
MAKIIVYGVGLEKKAILVNDELVEEIEKVLGMTIEELDAIQYKREVDYLTEIDKIMEKNDCNVEKAEYLYSKKHEDEILVKQLKAFFL